MSFPQAGLFPTIKSSLLFNGSTDYAVVGQPVGLTSVLNATSEFTILVRTCRTLSASSGVIIAQSDATNTAFSIFSAGGSRVSASIGGSTIVTGPGSIQYPTWNSVALVNRNAGSGVFQGRLVLDSAAGTAEVTSGAQVSTRDILIGGRRNSSNSDISSIYNGNIGAIAIWNSALSDDEIHLAMGYLTAVEMLSSLCPSGLIAYYPCSERSGTVVHDVVNGYDANLTSNKFSTASYPKPPVCLVGDSLITGAGSESSQPPGNQVVSGGGGVRNMRSILNYGFGGQNCTYILAKLQLASYVPFLSWTQVLQPGAHDYGNNALVLSYLSTVRSMISHNRFFVMGQRAHGVGTAGVGDSTSAGLMDYGTTFRAQRDSQEYAVRSVYGSRWLDCMSLSVSLANLPTEANDRYQLRTPTHLCSDNVHPLDGYYVPEAQALDALLNLFDC